MRLPCFVRGYTLDDVCRFAHVGTAPVTQGLCGDVMGCDGLRDGLVLPLLLSKLRELFQCYWQQHFTPIVHSLVAGSEYFGGHNYA